MQMNCPDATPGERKVIRAWRLSVTAFYGSLCVILLLLCLVSERSAPNVAGTPSNTAEALAAR